MKTTIQTNFPYFYHTIKPPSYSLSYFTHTNQIVNVFSYELVFFIVGFNVFRIQIYSKQLKNVKVTYGLYDQDNWCLQGDLL